MPTKKEYSAAINKLLGTDIDWKRLTTEDLIQFATLLNHPEVFIHRLGVPKTVQEHVVGGILQEAATSVIENWNGPIAKILRDALSKSEKSSETERKS